MGVKAEDCATPVPDSTSCVPAPVPHCHCCPETKPEKGTVCDKPGEKCHYGDCAHGDKETAECDGSLTWKLEPEECVTPTGWSGITGWSEEHRRFCCHHAGRGCPRVRYDEPPLPMI